MDEEQKTAGDKPGWSYNGDTGDDFQGPAQDSKVATEVLWSASEYIAHSKGFGWYLGLVIITAALAGLVYWLLRDFVSVAIVVVIAMIFGVAGSRKPRVLPYKLDSNGLTIGAKFYPYNRFKSFALIDEGPFTSITFLPLKRLDLGVSFYFPPDQGKKIIQALSSHLPLEQRQLDLVDSLMRSLRF